MELFARGGETLTQVLRKRCPRPFARPRSAALTYSISINSRLVFEIERDRAKDLRESQSFELQRDSTAAHVQTPQTRHQVNRLNS
jgi:hypothetical protein